MATVQDTLRSLGVSRKYHGFRLTVMAIELVLDNEDRLEAVTKEIYWEIANLCGCNRNSVERNIRTVVQRVWRINPSLLIQMAGYPMDSPPTVSEFIEVVSNYIRRSNAVPIDCQSSG